MGVFFIYSTFFGAERGGFRIFFAYICRSYYVREDRFGCLWLLVVFYIFFSFLDVGFVFNFCISKKRDDKILVFFWFSFC